MKFSKKQYKTGDSFVSGLLIERNMKKDIFIPFYPAGKMGQIEITRNNRKNLFPDANLLPPCQPGDELFILPPKEDKIIATKVYSVLLLSQRFDEKQKPYYIYAFNDPDTQYSEVDWGRQIFLTEAEAKYAKARRKESFILKKPIHDDQKQDNGYFCPTCKSHLSDSCDVLPNFCPNCAQAILR